MVLKTVFRGVVEKVGLKETIMAGLTEAERVVKTVFCLVVVLVALSVVF